jgi:hypothetical protein
MLAAERAFWAHVLGGSRPAGKRAREFQRDIR